MKAISALAFLVLALATANSAAAGTMRCNSSVVSLGETKAEVAMKCGEPASQDSRQEEIMERTEGAGTRVTTVTIDDWTYDFGPDSLIRYLTFRNNRLVGVREGGYGSSAPGKNAAACEEPFPDRGASRSEVIAKCGDPSWKDVRQEEIIESQDSGAARKVTETVEEWTYNLGPDRLIRIFEFRNGRLMRVRTGGYGQ
jgi:hypothetical protein